VSLDDWHPLLRRQVKRAGLPVSEDHAEFQRLLALVSATYDDTDQQRYLTDRAFELSGQEMLALNERLRRAGETELARQRDRLQAVFDAVPTGLIVVDAERRIVDLNPSAAELLGVPDGTEGVPLDDVLMPDPADPTSAATLAVLAEAMRAGLPWRGADIHVSTPTAGGFPGNLAFSPLRDDFGPAGGVLSVSDVSERLSAAAELAWRASHDALTGLPNRTSLLERLTALLATPDADPVAVLFIDLDRFKLVNDTLGHAAGDLLLMTAVERIVGAVRADDMVARLGGDEFVILRPGVVQTSDAIALADRIVATLSHPFAIGSDTSFVSASIGVTIGTAGQAAADLIRDADVALYQAKDRGRARAVLFDEAMRDAVAERVRLERQLRHALDDDDLTVVFQPIVRGADGVLAGFEALVRWHGPEFTVEPQVFVPLAEDAGLVGVLGEWVLETTVDFLNSLKDIGAPDVSASVNLSALQLSDPRIAERIEGLVARLHVPPWRLVLEITETALLDDPDLARDRLVDLRAIGVRIALDDFGTGYSSLSALRSFPLDSLKIDRTFVSGVIDSARDRAIVSAVTALGHGLGMTVVAEGVETVEQAQALVDLGCDRLQGFHLGYPMSADDARALAAQPRDPRWAADGPGAGALAALQADGISSGPDLAVGK
jgi:diguanylate cyclase (GGDEF)-like protein/PAS domain S-box-containing protein